MERRHHWITTVRLGCFIILLTSSLQTNWCYLISSSVLKHHWSTASILPLAIGHSQSPTMSPFHMAHLASCLPFIETTHLSCTVLQI